MDRLRGRLVWQTVERSRDRRDGAWQLRILARLGLVGDASGGQVPCHSSRPAGLRRLDRAARVRLERRRTRRRRRTLLGCVENPDLSSDRGQIRRIGLHAARKRAPASSQLALPVRITRARQRQRQRGQHPHQRRPAMGRGDHARAARQLRIRGAGPMVDRGADGKGQPARRVRRLLRAHRHGARGQAIAHHRTDADRHHERKRTAVGRSRRMLCRAHSQRARNRASRRQFSHRGSRARAVRATCAAVHGGGFAAQTGRRVERSRMKPFERDCAFPITVRSVDVGGLLTRRAFVGCFCRGLAGVGAMLPIAAARAAYPNRPVRIVVPFLPGGGADLIARLLSPHLQHSLGQPFVVENRAGAAGRIGTAVVAKSDPDGHVLLMTTESSLVIAPHLGVPLHYEPLKDFAPISLLTRNTVILVVHPSVPVNTLKDYIALARDKPGQLFFASSGVGGPNHLAGEIFNRMAGVNIVHVPFPGTGGAIQAVVGNQVGAMWGFMAGLIPHIRSGAVRALAVGGKARSPALPDVPTVAETGLPGYEATSWIGLLAPAGTPVVEMVWEAVNGALQDAAVRDILLRDGSEIVASRPEDFRAVIANDYAKYGKMADLLMSAK